ncbi:MAG TPA: DUF819 family protein [Bacteroidales bacterium]|nr:DUF819 family protein [Bacteroidales bacterium]
MTIIIISIYLLFPAVILFLAERYPIINRIGVVVFAYVGGLILGNSGVIPESMEPLQGDFMGVTILLGIPLVLFSENILKWIKMARYTFISLLLGVVSVVIMVFAGYFLLKDHIPEAGKVGGLLIGVYTGGTPNLAAIARGLNIDNDLYILTHTVDLAIGALVLLFLITGAKGLFGLFLKPYKSTGDYDGKRGEQIVSEFESYKGFFSRQNFPGVLKSFGFALIVFVIGYGMTFLFKGETKDTAAVLTVTTLGILFSLIPSVNKHKKSFQLGMYFIYVFCVIVASKANLSEIFNPDSRQLLMYIALYVAMAMVGSLFLHALLSKIFGITNDDFIITSTALSNSPPFVPVVAAALKNREVMIPGMIIGVIGYAIGNYLGVFVAYLLK